MKSQWASHLEKEGEATKGDVMIDFSIQLSEEVDSAAFVLKKNYFILFLNLFFKNVM